MDENEAEQTPELTAEYVSEQLKGRRVIVHVDLDSFYAQVEVRLGLPRTLPLAVQQWQLLVAVNYAARSRGVKKMSSVADALRVHTASTASGDTTPQYHAEPLYATHKISLDVYRTASVAVMRVLARFAPSRNCFQRASIDEAFIDLTDSVNARIRTLLPSSLPNKSPNKSLDEISSDSPKSFDFVAWSQQLTEREPLVDWSCANSCLVGLPQNTLDLKTKGWPDLQLRIAADICSEIRAAVESELNYTCSAGIAQNKTLAKLCSALNKPDLQTVLLPDQVLDFLRPLPFQKIRNLGGKLGTEIEDTWSVETCAQVWEIPIQELERKLGGASATWVHDIVRGICKEPVVQTQLQKSAGAFKALRPAATTPEEVLKWIHVLANEIFLRLKEEFEINARWPKTFTVSYHLESVESGSNNNQAGSAKSMPMPPRMRTTAPEIIAKLANSLIANTVVLPCRGLGLLCNGFMKEDVNTLPVTNFFKKVDFLAQLLPCDPSTNSDAEKPENILSESTNLPINQPHPQSDSNLFSFASTSIPSSSLLPLNFAPPEYQIHCDRCLKMIDADDTSLAEHEDYHIAIDLHQQQLHPLNTKKKIAVTDVGIGSAKKRRQQSGAGSNVGQGDSVITTFFKPK
ncbi:DNA-directed DNA polymerase eta rad30 [Physocladia obscura]|uniref:DNA polymerase eta n=1 Tax=Physocladia obscura TaxID=109957 RepID=A0AAD5STP4_9FUNG|nr:DNA-directed DNA polymerase eta rad30 [Physocladia obscura]